MARITPQDSNQRPQIMAIQRDLHPLFAIEQSYVGIYSRMSWRGHRLHPDATCQAGRYQPDYRSAGKGELS